LKPYSIFLFFSLPLHELRTIKANEVLHSGPAQFNGQTSTGYFNPVSAVLPLIKLDDPCFIASYTSLTPDPRTIPPSMVYGLTPLYSGDQDSSLAKCMQSA